MDALFPGWASILTPVGGIVIPLLLLFLALYRGLLVTGKELDRHQRQWEAERTGYLARISQQNERLDQAHIREQALLQVAQTSEETRRDVADQLRSRQTIDEVIVRAFSTGKAE
jgi:hypothetical protein